ncbi:hypothetical protein BKA93DRAFT_752118 [Sparassis latifolia]
MASAWPKLTQLWLYLRLAAAPSVYCLATFAQKCPLLKRLGILCNGMHDTPYPELPETPHPCDARNVRLSWTQLVITDSPRLARFIIDWFPNIDLQDVRDRRQISSEFLQLLEMFQAAAS